MVFHATAIVRHYDPYARSRGNGERTPSDDLRPSWTTLQAHWCLKPPALTLVMVEYSVIFTIFTALHASHARGLAMRKLSVRLSVKCVDCDKTKECSAQTFILYERTFILVFRQEWLVGDDPLYFFRCKLTTVYSLWQYYVLLFTG